MARARAFSPSFSDRAGAFPPPSRLFHQLTEAVQKTLVDEQFRATGQDLVRLYSEFLEDFAPRLNQLSLLNILTIIADLFTDAKAALDFLDGTVAVKVAEAEKTARSGGESELLLKLEKTHIRLRLGDVETVKTDLRDAEAALDKSVGFDAIIHAKFHLVASEYYKAVGPPADFFKHALLYLAFVKLETLPASDKVRLAYELGLAALVGDNIFNFGELLTHPILTCLDGEHAWIGEILFAFNKGDIAKYDQLTQQYAAQMNKEATLVSNEKQLREKISLLALIDLVFKRETNNRTFSFAEVAAATHVPVTDVEFLIMRGLSLGLIKGSIDEIDSQVTITWILPRVLEMDQIAKMIPRLEQWAETVSKTSDFFAKQAPELA